MRRLILWSTAALLGIALGGSPLAQGRIRLTADAGAALCVRAYRALERGPQAPDADALVASIDDYCARGTTTPHVVRWQISLRYVQALLQLEDLAVHGLDVVVDALGRVHGRIGGSASRQDQGERENERRGARSALIPHPSSL